MRYKLLIDESGDQGLDRIRGSLNDTGATPFFTLGAVLVPEVELTRLRELYSEVCKAIGKDNLHCVDLSHFQTAYAARRFSECRVLLFGVVSKKGTLGTYKSEIGGKNQAESYYNKCSQYLLELVGRFAGSKSIASSDISIVFEKKKHDYQRMRSFLTAIRRTPMDQRANALANIDPLSITAATKLEEPLLGFADLAAFSLFQSVNQSKANFGVAEERYLRELLPKFSSEPETGRVANFGIKYVKGPNQMGLSGQMLAFAQKQYKAKAKQ